MHESKAVFRPFVNFERKVTLGGPIRADLAPDSMFLANLCSENGVFVNIQEHLLQIPAIVQERKASLNVFVSLGCHLTLMINQNIKVFK